MITGEKYLRPVKSVIELSSNANDSKINGKRLYDKAFEDLDAQLAEYLLSKKSKPKKAKPDSGNKTNAKPHVNVSTAKKTIDVVESSSKSVHREKMCRSPKNKTEPPKQPASSQDVIAKKNNRRAKDKDTKIQREELPKEKRVLENSEKVAQVKSYKAEKLVKNQRSIPTTLNISNSEMRQKALLSKNLAFNLQRQKPTIGDNATKPNFGKYKKQATGFQNKRKSPTKNCIQTSSKVISSKSGSSQNNVGESKAVLQSPELFPVNAAPSNAKSVKYPGNNIEIQSAEKHISIDIAPNKCDSSSGSSLSSSDDAASDSSGDSDSSSDDSSSDDSSSDSSSSESESDSECEDILHKGHQPNHTDEKVCESIAPSSSGNCTVTSSKVTSSSDNQCDENYSKKLISSAHINNVPISDRCNSSSKTLPVLKIPDLQLDDLSEISDTPFESDSENINENSNQQESIELKTQTDTKCTVDGNRINSIHEKEATESDSNFIANSELINNELGREEQIVPTNVSLWKSYSDDAELNSDFFQELFAGILHVPECLSPIKDEILQYEPGLINFEITSNTENQNSSRQNPYDLRQGSTEIDVNQAHWNISIPEKRGSNEDHRDRHSVSSSTSSTLKLTFKKCKDRWSVSYSEDFLSEKGTSIRSNSEVGMSVRSVSHSDYGSLPVTIAKYDQINSSDKGKGYSAFKDSYQNSIYPIKKLPLDTSCSIKKSVINNVYLKRAIRQNGCVMLKT